MPIGIVSKSWLKSLVSNGSEESNAKVTESEQELDPRKEELAAMSSSQDQESQEKTDDDSTANESANLKKKANTKAEPKAERNAKTKDEPEEGSEEKPFRLGAASPSSSDKESEDESDDSELDGDDSEPEAVTEGEEDPLAPGYCLDDGELMNEEDEPTALPWQSRVTSAKDFFSTEILYRYDILEDDLRKKVLGSYRIELRGFKGGVWTLELADDLNIVNRKEEADTVLSMQQKDFIHLVNGELNPQIAILAQKVKVTGDVKKALALQELLAPASE